MKKGLVVGTAVLIASLASCGSGSSRHGAAQPSTSLAPVVPASTAAPVPSTMPAPPATQAPSTTPPSSTTGTAASTSTTPVGVTSPPTTSSPSPSTTTTPAPSPPGTGPLGSGGPGSFPPTSAGVLSGRVVAMDPGHNGGNFAAASVIDQTVFNGREQEACDTTGSQTDSGYTEAAFNFAVAQAAMADLRAHGATVVLTRTTNTGVGPCITQRAAIGNDAHADAAVSIHADGGPPDGRGFDILEPVADGINSAVIGSSDALGAALRTAFAAGTGEPVSDYDGTAGLQPRDDLGGINLTTVPKVFIECANMRNATDAALVTSPAWQAQAGAAIANGITAFLTGGS
jgi:N-acetylmuramoyl-L-alanine amidase